MLNYIVNYIRKKEILAILFLILLSTANRYSLITSITTHVYFNGADYSIFTWILAWDCHSFESLKFKNFWATNAMYPYNYVLAFSENLIGLIPISLPIWLTSHNPILTFNLTLHILLILTSISSFSILRKVVKNNLAALIGAVIFSFYPYNLWSYTIGHPHMVALMLLPILTHINIKYWEGGRTIHLIIFGLLWLWNFIISIYVGILLALYFGIWNIIWFMFERNIFTLSKVIKWCICVIIVWVIMLPIFLIYYEVVKDMGAIRTLDHQLRYTGYVWSWIVAPPDNLLWSKIIKILPSSRIMSAEDAMFPGIMVFILFILSYITKTLPVWLRSLRIASIILSILAIGPYTLGIPIKIPLPYILIWYLFPPLKAVRNPHRLSIFVLLGCSFLIAFMFSKLIQKSKKWKIISILILIIVCIECFSYYNSVEGMHPEKGKLYKELLSDKEKNVIIELPMPRSWSGWVSETKPLLNSIYHWNYVFNGISGLWPPAQYQVGKELKNFPSQHTIALLQSLGINTIIINENRYIKRLNILLEKMKQFEQLHFIKRIGNISIWKLEEGIKAIEFKPDKHIKLFCENKMNKINNLRIVIKDDDYEFIFNKKAPAHWKFPIAEPWKIKILDKNNKIVEEKAWSPPAIFHSKNNTYQVGIGQGIKIQNQTFFCPE